MVDEQPMLPVLDNDRTKPAPKKAKQTKLDSYFILLPLKSIEKKNISSVTRRMTQTTLKDFWITEAEQSALDWDLYNNRRRRWRRFNRVP